MSRDIPCWANLLHIPDTNDLLRTRDAVIFLILEIVPRFRGLKIKVNEVRYLL